MAGGWARRLARERRARLAATPVLTHHIRMFSADLSLQFLLFLFALLSLLLAGYLISCFVDDVAGSAVRPEGAGPAAG
jgi:hypothetical protein